MPSNLHLALVPVLGILAGTLAASARADVVFADGAEHTYAGTDSGGLQVRDAPDGSPTQVDVLAGASLGSVSSVAGASVLRVQPGASFADRLSAAGTARLEVSGGSFRTIDILEGAHADIAGGSFSCAGSGRCVGLFDASTATIRGGDFDNAPVVALEQSTLAVLGGSFAAGLEADRGTVDVLGGAVGRLQATNATLTLVGGAFVVMPAGAGGPLFTGHGEIGEFSSGLLDGVLADGTVLVGVPYAVGNNGRLVLSPVPAPAAVWLFGAGLAVLVARIRLQRGRTARTTPGRQTA